jgi:poly(A) polymerase
MASGGNAHEVRAAATRVVERLRFGGFEAYFAGGCVRDELLGRNPTDYDVATSARPDDIARVFPGSQGVGAAFGVMLVSIPIQAAAPGTGVERAVGAERGERAVIEVATFRVDGPYADARRPTRVRFADAEHDAQRRDFTINALFLDPLDTGASPVRGRVIDFVGGQADLSARVIRAVGDPDARLAEDHLRALRAVRFAARLGFSLDPATGDAIRRHASDLRGVSRERVGDELRRMLGQASAPSAVALLEALGLDAPVLDEASQRSDTLEVLGRAAGASDPMLGLAAWLVDRHRARFGGMTGAGRWLDPAAQSSAVGRLRRNLCLSNHEVDALNAYSELGRLLDQAFDGLAVARAKRLASRPGVERALRLLDPARGAACEARIAVLSDDGVGIAPAPLLTGDLLVARGYKPGPAFKRALDEVYDAQLEGRVRGVPEALAQAAAILGGKAG